MGEPAPVPPLVVEATKKAGLVWLTVAGQRPAPAWLLWRDPAAYVVTGGGEQPLPGLAGAAECDVTVRSGDNGGRIVTWRARVDRVEPGGAEWGEVVPALLTARLNLRDAADAEQRWATSGAVLRLTPTGELVEAGGSLPSGSLAAAAPPSPARTPTRVPTTLHRRPRAR
ncbi:MAG TPA: hypothetical protein VE547_03625 [Mycobacteriales bacterium]|nr:hypothetical protein [Mycobacteriales bacterium]